MKNGRCFRAGRWICVAVLGLDVFGLVAAQGQTLPTPPPFWMLSRWRFDDTNWANVNGYLPTTATNLQLLPSFSGNAVEIAGSAPLLQYNVVEPGGPTNIVCDNGVIECWFRPAWSSANAGGSGPGSYARLIDIGAYTTNASYGWWSLYSDPGGTNLYFSSQTNGASATYLSAPIAWESNWWHIITLTYSSSNSALYIDGDVVTNGVGVSYWPASSVLSNGFAVGSDLSRTNVARGTFDYLRTWGNWLDAEFVTNHQQYVIAYFDPNGDGGMQGNSPGLLEGDPLSGCVTSGPVFLTNITAIVTTNAGVTVTLSVMGGTNGVLYDIFSTTNLIGESITNAQWVWLGQVTTCNTYTLTNQADPHTIYVLGVTNDLDGDGLTDAYERLVSKTNPNNPDTDGDGFTDGWEVLNGLNPLLDDSAQTGSRANFSYDRAGRLLQVTGTRTESLGIDGEGNVLSQ